MADLQDRSVELLSGVLSEELRGELRELQGSFASGATPTADELRIAQAQLVGWLEGLFQGVRMTLITQKLASEEQLVQAYAETLRNGERRDPNGSTPYL